MLEFAARSSWKVGMQAVGAVLIARPFFVGRKRGDSVALPLPKNRNRGRL
jgi:hypothetical protein